jgi:hypothetical protein
MTGYFGLIAEHARMTGIAARFGCAIRDAEYDAMCTDFPILRTEPRTSSSGEFEP